MSDTLITVDGVSKKFCRSLKKSLWYGVIDLRNELIGQRHGGNGELRPDEFWAVKDVSFELKRGECLGLIGRNGAGKTTLLRMLNGLVKPDQGRITMRGRVGALIALGAGFNPILTGRENMYVNAAVLGIPKAEVDRRFESIMDFAGILEFIDTPVQNYSSGMAVRLGFAIAAHVEPDILLVDEVLAVGDEGFQIKCLNKIGELRTSGTAIIVVSHNMHTVSTYCNRILVKNIHGAELFTDVSAAVHAYKRLVHDNVSDEIEKHCSGSDAITFYDVAIAKTELGLSDDFAVRLHYRASSDVDDVEVDVALRLTAETGVHYQATNRTFGHRVDLARGDGWLDISVRNLRVIQSAGTFGIAIWRNNREQLLLWWRIPVRFITSVQSSGVSLYDTEYATGLDLRVEAPDRARVASSDLWPRS
jgi:lipopolysaccharide transport system ATP-binding protein